MPRSELESLAERHVPGGGKPRISVLRTGLVHDTYRVERDESSFALRVPCANPIDLGLDLAWEARALERAAQAGLAPAPRYTDAGRGIMVVDWVEGRSWSAAEARLPVNLNRMAELLRRLHALPAPMPPRNVTPLSWIDRYTDALGRTKGAGGVQARLQSAARARTAQLAATGGAETGLCHSDLHVLNVVDRGASLALLDWEYAHVSDPLWDVAGWSANNDFTVANRYSLATAYRGRPPTPAELARLGLLEWLYDFVCLLWSELYLSSHGGGAPRAAREHHSIDSGIRERAHVLETRLEASLR